MSRTSAIVVAFACIFACAKGGGGANAVDCNRLQLRISDCVTELAMSQATIGPGGRSAGEALAAVLAGPIGSDCPQKRGKLENAKAVNECLAKRTCAEVAACFDALKP